MKQNKKIYVLTLEEKYNSITDILVLGTFSNERSAKEVMDETFDAVYKRNYSMLKITDTILDKWKK